MFRDVPSALQLFLHFSVGAAPSAGLEMDIIVEKTCTVKDVRKKNVIFLFGDTIIRVYVLFKIIVFVICSV